MYPTFNDYIKSRGWNQKRLAEAARINPGVFSHRVNGRQDWQWTEVRRVCEVLNITLEEFAEYYPAGTRIRVKRPPTNEERIDSVLSELRSILIQRSV